jgi:NAD(P)-dependent dehydrogenase (short-subunit alcohol dehydrogenase family)
MSERYVVVTGANGGIGRKTCQLLVAEGFQIFALDKSLPDPDNKSVDLYTWIRVDIADHSDILSAYEMIKSHTSELHGLVNIAGIFDQFPLMEAEHKRFNDLVFSNFIGHQHLTKTFFPLLYRRKGRVINLSSETVLASMPLQSYAFSKKLFEAWNDQLRMELGLLGMHVIIIRAGGHATQFIQHSVDVLSNYDQSSKYAALLQKVKDNGNKILKGVKKDPKDVAAKVVWAMTDPRPAQKYHVNVSLLFRFLAIIPRKLRERLIIAKLKSWM